MGRKSKTEQDLQKTALLGKELKRFRIRQGKAQFDVMQCMGWRSVSPIIKIEKGRRLPERATILRWGECLELSDADVHYLLGIAGYVPTIKLPAARHIAQTLGQIAGYLRTEPYPAYVIDDRFAYWAANPAAAMMAGGTEALSVLARQFAETFEDFPLVTVFDLLFNEVYGIRSLIKPLEQIEIDQIFRFKAYNLYYRHLPHYRAYPECMKSRMDERSFQHFVDVWNSVDDDVESQSAVYPFGKFGRIKETVILEVGDDALEFDVVLHPIPHLRNRFGVILYHPADRPRDMSYEENRGKCEQYFQYFAQTDEECVKMWEILDDFEAMVNRYNADP